MLVLLGFHFLIISPKTTRVLRDCLETGHNPLPFLWQPHLAPEPPHPHPPLQGWLCWLEEGDPDRQEEVGMDSHPPGAHGPPLCSQDVLLAKSFTEGPGRGSGFQHLPLPRRLRAPQVPAPPTDALPLCVPPATTLCAECGSTWSIPSLVPCQPCCSQEPGHRGCPSWARASHPHKGLLPPSSAPQHSPLTSS